MFFLSVMLFVSVCVCCLMRVIACGLLCDAVGVCCCAFRVVIIKYVSVCLCVLCLNVFVCFVCDFPCGVVCVVAVVLLACV